MFATRCKAIGLACGILLLMHCATVNAPRRWLPAIEEAQRLAYGGWLTVTASDAADLVGAEGELIAIQDGKIYLLSGDQVFTTPQTKIYRARLAIYRNQATTAGMVTLLGIVSTISHGFYSMISAPIWLIAGAGMTGRESSGGFLDFPSTPWEEMRKFARFPQGLPPGLDLKLLKPKDTGRV